MIMKIKSQSISKQPVVKALFAILFLGMVLILNGCGDDGDAPIATDSSTDSGDSSATSGDGTTDTDGTSDDGGTSAAGGMPTVQMTQIGSEKASYPYDPVIGTAFSFKVYFKDRLGIYSGLVNNDNVTFVAADGAASVDSVTVENGIAIAKLRVHDSSQYYKAPVAWENKLFEELAGDSSSVKWLWDSKPSGTPGDGQVSVLWYTRGEEWYTEKQGPFHNNSYDVGEETYVDSEDDPYLDENGNGVFDAEEPYTDINGNGSYDKDVDTFTPENDKNHNGEWDWAEIFVDDDGDGQRDGKNDNGWEADKYIFGNVPFVMTGTTSYIGWDSADVSIASGATEKVPVIVCDRNFNHLPAGAKIEFSLESEGKSEISGKTSFTIKNTFIGVVNPLLYPDVDVFTDDEAIAKQKKFITYNISINNSEAGTATLIVSVTEGGMEDSVPARIPITLSAAP